MLGEVKIYHCLSTELSCHHIDNNLNHIILHFKSVLLDMNLHYKKHILPKLNLCRWHCSCFVYGIKNHFTLVLYIFL